MASCFLCQILQSSALTILIIPPNFNPVDKIIHCVGLPWKRGQFSGQGGKTEEQAFRLSDNPDGICPTSN